MMKRRMAAGLGFMLLTFQLNACGPQQSTPCGGPVQPHPEVAGQLLYTCYPAPQAGYAQVPQVGGRLYLLDVSTGQIRPLTTDRAWSWTAGWSPDGRRIAYMSTRGGRMDLYLLDLTGGDLRRLTDGRGFNEWPSWSPDGLTIAFASTRDGITKPPGNGHLQRDLYTIRSDGTDLRRLTNLAGFNGDPAWSPDGKRIAFGSDRDGGFDLFTMAADGSDQRPLTRLHQSGGRAGYARWSPDGSRIVFNGANPRQDGRDNSIYWIPAQGGEPRRVTQEANGLRDVEPDWSPDGRWISFLRGLNDHWDLFVVRPDGSELMQLTNDGARKEVARWRPV